LFSLVGICYYKSTSKTASAKAIKNWGFGLLLSLIGLGLVIVVMSYTAGKFYAMEHICRMLSAMCLLEKKKPMKTSEVGGEETQLSLPPTCQILTGFGDSDMKELIGYPDDSMKRTNKKIEIFKGDVASPSVNNTTLFNNFSGLYAKKQQQLQRQTASPNSTQSGVHQQQHQYKSMENTDTKIQQIKGDDAPPNSTQPGVQQPKNISAFLESIDQSQKARFNDVLEKLIQTNKTDTFGDMVLAQNIEGQLEKIENDRHQIHSKLMVVKYLFAVCIIVVALWTRFTTWIKKNPIYFSSFLVGSFLVGVLGMVLIMFIRGAPLRDNQKTIWLTGVISAMFYFFIEYAGLDAAFLFETPEACSVTKPPSTPSSTPPNNTVVIGEGFDKPNACTPLDKEYNKMKGQSMERFLIIFGGLMGVFAVYALFVLLGYSVGFSLFDSILQDSKNAPEYVIKLNQLKNEIGIGSESNGYRHVFQKNGYLSLLEAFIFALCTTLINIAVYFTYNPKSEWGKGKFWGEQVALMVKFMILWYILVCLHVIQFHMKDKVDLNSPDAVNGGIAAVV
jgi:hypothetical protein